MYSTITLKCREASSVLINTAIMVTATYIYFDGVLIKRNRKSKWSADHKINV